VGQELDLTRFYVSFRENEGPSPDNPPLMVRILNTGTACTEAERTTKDRGDEYTTHRRYTGQAGRF
jgi:hypothetical protein